MMRYEAMKSFQSLVLVVFFAANIPVAKAGGFFGDAINVIAPGVGTRLDKANADLKNSVPIYKQFEEGVITPIGRVPGRIVDESIVESVGPVLAQMIFLSRDSVLPRCQAMPPSVRAVFEGKLPEDVLNKVVFCVGNGGDLTLQTNAFRYGDAAAITLEHVIVFRSMSELQSVKLWAHELHHVVQYTNWGVHDFAKRYVRDFHSVEQEAVDYANNFNGAVTASTPANIFRFVAKCAFQNDPNTYVVSSSGQIFMMQAGSGQPVVVGAKGPARFAGCAWTFQTVNAVFDVLPDGRIMTPTVPGGMQVGLAVNP